ncbi:MAG: hypothetical protein JW741_15995 [Sedimentisphaerales bacterium]|nr:hypothetical protein [Sedimentisphaerales bacterium]
MKKTAAIAAGCVALALIWAWRPDTRSDAAIAPQEMASSMSALASGISGQCTGAFQRGDETPEPAPDGPSSVSEEFQQETADEPGEASGSPADAFWALLSEPAPLPETQAPGMTLDQFDRPYAMTMTEAGFAQLSPADKSAAMDEIVPALHQARHNTRDTCAQADVEIAAGHYDRAEIALLSECQRLGELSANQEGLYLTRIIGIHYQQTTLKKLETLYTRTGNHSRLQATQQQWHDLEARKRAMQAAQVEQAGG